MAFSFNQNARPTFGTSLFNQPALPPSTSIFNFGNTFGQTQSSGMGSTLGSNAFGQPSALSIGQTSSLTQQPFGGSNLFSSTQMFQQQQQRPVIQSISEVFSPKIFNDERDRILGKLNRLQSYWGCGKAIYSVDGCSVQLIDLDQAQSAHRFKAIVYSEYNKDADDVDGIGIVVRYDEESVLKTSILSYENNLKTIFNQYPVKAESIKLLPAKKALINFSVTDSSNNRKVTSSQLLSHLTSANIKNQLPSVFANNFIQIVPLSGVSKQEIEEYLSHPPLGIDQLIWSQAKLENPDPSQFIPVPLIGFASLNERFQLQEQEINQQKNRMKIISDEVSSLERSIELTKAKLEEARKRNVPIRAKVLRAMVYLDVVKKKGFSIQPEEDELRAKLEKILQELNAPNKFRGCLNELISRVRQMHYSSFLQSSSAASTLDESIVTELQVHLKKQQEAISHLLSTLKEDQATLSRLTSAMD